LERALVISSKLKNINKVREILQEVYQEYCLNMNSFNRVFLGISEAVNNAIVHGNRLNPEKKVLIKMNLSGNQFNVEVEDEGEGFSEEVLFDPTISNNRLREHGRGVYIIKQLASGLFFEDEGRRVIIQFTIPE
jgi:serine/threonine-protein kinase RsbW